MAPTNKGGYWLFGLLLVALVFLAACNGIAPMAMANPSATQFVVPSQTPTHSPPTRTPTPTAFTVAERPLGYPSMGTALPFTSEIIDESNIHRIEQIGQWGLGVANAIVYSPDGSLLAVGTGAGVALFEAHDLSNHIGFIPMDRQVKHLALSPDSNLLAVGGGLFLDVFLNVYDISSPTNARVLWAAGEELTAVGSMEMSPNGRVLGMNYGFGRVTFFDVQTGTTLRDFSSANDFDFLPHGNQVALGRDHAMEFYNLQTWERTSSVEIENVNFVEYSRNGDYIFVTQGVRLVSVLSAGSGEILQTIPEQDIITYQPAGTWCFDDWYGVDPVQFDPPFARRIFETAEPGQFVVLYKDQGSATGVLRFFHLGSNEPFAELALEFASDVAVSPDGSHFAATLPKAGLAGIWNLESRQMISANRHFYPQANDVQFSADGSLLAVNFPQTAYVFSVTNGQILVDGFSRIEMSPIDQNMVVADESNRLYRVDPASGEQTLITQADGQVLDLAISTDGETLYSSTYNCELAAWDLESGIQLTRFEHPDGDAFAEGSVAKERIEPIAISPDGGHLFGLTAGITYYHQLFVWDTETGDFFPLEPSRLPQIYKPPSAVPVVLENGQILAAFHDWIATYDAESANLSDPLILNADYQGGMIRAIAVHPTQSVAALGAADGSVYIVDLEDFSLIYRFQAHDNGIEDVVGGLAFSPDGRLLVTIAKDGLIKIWAIP